MAFPIVIGTFTHDKLIAGDKPFFPRAGIILAAEPSLSRGAVLGRVAGAASETHVGNTGNGVMGAITPGKLVEQGKQYKLQITAASANAGSFNLYGPDGTLLKTGTVGVAFTSDHLNFTLADGATDFIVGDTFLINVAQGTKYRLVNSANTDGSGKPVGVLLTDIPTSVSDTVDGVVFAQEGEFRESALSFGGTDTLATHKNAMRDLGMLTRASQDVNGLGQ
jgi:hypothetical protein